MKTQSRGAVLAVALVVALAVIPAVAFAAVGDFGQPSSSPESAGKSPTSVATGNFNGDAHTDLAVSNSGDSNVSILLGDGSGNFTSVGTESAGGSPWRVITANLNGDAHTDLAAALSENKVSILLGDGSGNFTAAGTSPETVGGIPGSGPRSLVAADLDGDTDIDLAVANFFPADVTILLNDGTGNFTPAASSPEDAGGNATNAASIVTGNFNGDADIDFAVSTGFSDEVRVYLNDGDEDGDFTAAPSSPETGVDGTWMTTGNFNGDANTDLALATGGGNSAAILLGDGTGNFTAAGTSPEAVGGEAAAITAANLNNDAHTDLAVGGGGSTGVVTVLLGNGSADFTPTATSPGTAGAYPNSIVAANLNGDANTDLAVTNFLSDNVAILLNDFTPVVDPPVDPPAGETSSATANTPPASKGCGKGKVLKNGKCVPKTCPKGKKLKKGKCVKKAKSRRKGKSGK